MPNSPVHAWAPVVLLLIIAIGFAVINIAASIIIGPKRTGPGKETTYESGMIPVGDTRKRFNVRFYIVAMIFLVFDVEIVFFYPWAGIFARHVHDGTSNDGLILLIEMLVFVVILLVAYLYAWGKGVFRWDWRTENAAAWWRVRPIFLIVLLAVILRVWTLGQPTIWFDEAMTWGRVVGTYRELLDELQLESFAPLHYELYWCLNRVLAMTPPLMRALPMLAGILMVPAMYALARQLAGRWVANLTALFTACSAFLLVYSRDAKMYMHFWLFCVLTVLCFLKFLQSGRRIIWLAWIACGLVMVGLDTLGLIVVGLLPIFLITSGMLNWRRWTMVIIGLTIIASAPIGYYLKFNGLLDRAAREELGRASGTDWIGPYNRGRDARDLCLFTTTEFLFSWEWPRAVDQPNVDAEHLRWLRVACISLLALAGLGAIVAPKKWRASDEAGLVAGRWRVRLWLVAWMVVPAYLFYCRSIVGFQTPGDWLRNGWVESGILLSGAACIVGLIWFRRWGLNILAALGIAAVALFLCHVIAWNTREQPTGSIWMPRYLAVAWPAFAIAFCGLISRLPTRAFRWMAIALLLAVNLKQFSDRVAWNGLGSGAEPPIDRMASDIVASDAQRRETIGTRTVLWRPRSITTRVYALPFMAPPGPGDGSLVGPIGRYYFSMDGNYVLSAREFRLMPNAPLMFFYGFDRNTDPTHIARDVAANKQVDHVIVWDSLPKSGTTGSDPLIEQLGGNWNLADEEQYAVLDHWRWLKIAEIRRREYVRKT